MFRYGRNIFVAFVVLLSFQSVFATEKLAKVYFIRGAPWDSPGPNILAAQEILKNYIAQFNGTIDLEMLHNSSYISICNKLKLEQGRTDPKYEKVILMGHSYGGSAAIVISRCLQAARINVDLVVTLDPVNRPTDANVELVPENVALNASFYQAIDPTPILRGLRNMRRPDGTYRGIFNTQRTPAQPQGAHSKMVLDLFEDGIVQDMLDEQFQHALFLTSF